LSSEEAENAQAAAHLGYEVQALRTKAVPLFMNKRHTIKPQLVLRYEENTNHSEHQIYSFVKRI
jgi:hypothetical protein